MMADLIDRQALLRDIEKYHLSDGKFQHWVEVQPSVEAEPVRHGHWINHPDDLFPEDSMIECSVCHEYEYATANDNFCGSCGAKMDEVT